ncbi:MAG: carboxyl transferase domain-containing protein, partial [Oscillospiraceae bacterium]|nr:carboxyl transferase domain-containing protein [Oscillospiraceae bacterium]
VYALAQSGAALSKKDTAKAVKVLEMAAKTGNPVVTFYDSIGSDLTEGLAALTGASEVAGAVAKLSGVVPQIAVVTGVCGGVAALAATSADVCIATKGCELFFTPPFTAEAAGDKVTGAGTAEKAAEAGVAHIVAEDLEEAVAAAAKLVAVLPANNLTGTGCYQFDAPTAALNMAKYTGKDAATAIVDGDSAVELWADFGTGAYTAIATVAGEVTGVVATEGADKNLCKTTVSKVSRFVRLCDAFGIPVVSIVNTKGFVKSTTEDIAGGVRQAARLMATYADATTAKVCLVTGNAVGAVYTAFANSDVTIALDTAVVAPVEPTAAATVLYKEELADSKDLDKDTAALAKRYIAEVAGADALLAAGVADMTATAATARGTVIAALNMLATKRVQRMPKKHGNMAL